MKNTKSFIAALLLSVSVFTMSGCIDKAFFYTKFF